MGRGGEGYTTAKPPSSAVEHAGFVFDALDCDGDGKITGEEHNAGFVRLRSCDQSSTTTKITGEEHNDGFDTMDLNKNGTFSKEEFNCAIFSVLNEDGDGQLTREEYEAGFDRLDFDGDGYMSKDKSVEDPLSRAVASRFSFEVLDADGDGVITAAEYEKGFEMLDQNKKGFISELEFNSVCSVPFKLLDKDGDGKISRSEWDAGFAVFDTDGDGKITKSEFHTVSGAGFGTQVLEE